MNKNAMPTSKDRRYSSTRRLSTMKSIVRMFGLLLFVQTAVLAIPSEITYQGTVR